MNAQRGQFRLASHRGFTLLELVVALFIVAILAGVLANSMYAAFKAKSSAEAAVEPGRTAGLALDFLREDLQNAVTPPPSSTTTGTSTSTAAATTAVTLAGTFVGVDGKGDGGRDADDLIFYSTASGPQHDSGNGEIKMIELTIITPPNSTERALVRRVTSNLLTLGTVTTPTDDEILCRGVAGFNLRYYDGTQWKDSWDSTQLSDELPVAVEVTLTLERPGSVGRTRQLKYIRVFPLSCSKLLADQAAAAATTTGGTTP